MGLEEFNKDLAPLLNVIFAAANFIALFFLYYQIRLTRRWNQLQSKYNFIDTTELPHLERAMLNALEGLGIRLFDRQLLPLQPTEMSSIFANVEATLCLNYFINDMQNLCAAYNYGIINRAIFQSIHMGRVRWWYNILFPFVHSQRDGLKDDHLWVDFESIGSTGHLKSFRVIAARSKKEN